MLEVCGCFLLIYGIYIPPAIAISLYKPQLLSIWLLSVFLAAFPLIITSAIYVQAHWNVSDSSSYIFLAPEQTILLVLSIIHVCLQWLVKISIFVTLTKWQHRYAHTVILENKRNKRAKIVTATTITANATSNSISDVNNNINTSNNSSNNNNTIEEYHSINLQHEVVFWSTRFRTLPLSMTVGAAFGFVSVIASVSTQFDLSLQIDHYGARHLSSYNFDICPQLPSLVHEAVQSCLLSFAHVAWGAMTGQVVFALSEIGVRTYWNHYCSIGLCQTWGEWWKRSTWRQVHSYNNTNNNNDKNFMRVNNGNVLLNSETTNSNINIEIIKSSCCSVEDDRLLKREEMLSLSLHDEIEVCENNTKEEVQDDYQDKAVVNCNISIGNMEDTGQGINKHLSLLSSTATEIKAKPEEREEEEWVKEQMPCYHKEREEEEEEEEQEEERPVDQCIDNTCSVNEQTNCIRVTDTSDSVFVDDGTHKLIFAIVWVVLYFTLQLVFTILPILYHRHGAFDLVTMRESNRTGCVVTLPVQLVLVTISYIGFVWLAREEEVHNEIE